MAVGVLRGDVFVRLGGDFVCNGGVLCFWSWVERGDGVDGDEHRGSRERENGGGGGARIGPGVAGGV